MELYFIDCIWIILTIAGVALTSPKIITNNTLFQQLTTFGKTRVKSFRFDVPKAWFSHFYLLGTCFLTFLLYRWCLGRSTKSAGNRTHVDLDDPDFRSASFSCQFFEA